VIPRASA